MPAIWSEAAQLLTSGLIVAAVAAPVGLLARALRPRGEPLLPRWKPWRVPWSGFEVTVAFLMVPYVLPMVANTLLTDNGFFQRVYGADFPAPGAEGLSPERAAEAATVRMLWANLLSLPIALGALWLAARALYPARKAALAGRGSLAGKVWLAVLAWLALAPIVLAFNAVVNAVFQQFDVVPEQHSLAALGGRPLLDRVLFVLEACAAAPLREEVIFRGVLLAWCVGRLRVPGGGGGAALDKAAVGAVMETVEPRATPTGAAVSPFTAARPWFVMAAALGFAVLSDKQPAVAFAVLLLIGLGVLWRFKRTGARRARAVYATAALFAVVHSGVWPSPIPLFLLGLGLGWLAVRTNGVLVPVIVHGLFNAVAAVFVLRA